MLAAAPRLGDRIVAGLILVAVAAFAAAPVLLSHDVFSYVDYARLGVRHGLDPYVHAPDAVPDDPAFARVTWTETTSAYGPLFTLATYPLAWLPVGLAIGVLKAVAAFSVLALAAVVARLAGWRGVDPRRAAALVALNPLVLVHVVGGAHNDGLAMLVVTVGVAALWSGREASAGVSLVAAAAVKASALFVAPFAVVAAGRDSARSRDPGAPGTAPPTGRKSLYFNWNRPVDGLGGGGGPDSVPARLRQVEPGRSQGGTGDLRRGRLRGGGSPLGRLTGGALGAAVMIAVGAWLAFGRHWTHAFGLAGENQGRTSHLSIPITFARLTGIDPDPVRAGALVLLAVAVVYLLVWTWRGGDWVRAAAWTGFALLLATSWMLPWYLIWPLPLVAVARDRPLVLLTLALTAYQLGARIPL